MMKYIFYFLFLLTVTCKITGQASLDSLYIEKKIVLHTTSGDIIGTMTIPVEHDLSKIVLIIAGSGPTNKDGNSIAGLITNSYKMLAHGMAENGISSVRYDKRGIGESAFSMKSESEIRFEDYFSDAESWVIKLDSMSRFNEIIILGHSEGSLIGMIAAKNSAVDKFISIAGIGSPASEIIGKQLSMKISGDLLAESNNILDSLKVGKTVKNADPKLSMLFRESVQPYLMSWFKYDPSNEIQKLKKPVLIIQGKADIQVELEEAEKLKKANPDAELIVIDNMDHVMKESLKGENIYKNYADPVKPLKPELLDALVEFIIID